MNWRLGVGIAVLGLAAIGRGQAATTLTEWGAVSAIASSTCASDYCSANTEAEAIAFALNIVPGPVDGGKGAATTSVSSGTWS